MNALTLLQTAVILLTAALQPDVDLAAQQRALTLSNQLVSFAVAQMQTSLPAPAPVLMTPLEDAPAAPSVTTPTLPPIPTIDPTFGLDQGNYYGCGPEFDRVYPTFDHSEKCPGNVIRLTSTLQEIYRIQGVKADGPITLTKLTLAIDGSIELTDIKEFYLTAGNETVGLLSNGKTLALSKPISNAESVFNLSVRARFLPSADLKTLTTQLTHIEFQDGRGRAIGVQGLPLGAKTFTLSR